MNWTLHNISILGLLIGINLFFLFLWGFFFGPYLLFGQSDLGIFIGYLVRMAAVVLIFYWWNRGSLNIDTDSSDPDEGKIEKEQKLSRIEIKTRDLLILALFDYCMPYFVVQILLLFGTTFDSQPSLENSSIFLFDFLIVVVAGPIVEEIVFRWMFFKIIDYFDENVLKISFNLKLGLNVSMFALIHYGVVGTAIFSNNVYIVWIFSWTLGGIIYFLIYYISRSLKNVILCHMIFNSIVMIVRYVTHYTESEILSNLVSTPVLILLTIVLFLILYYNNYRETIFRVIRVIKQINPVVFFVVFPIFNIILWVITYPFFYFLFDTTIIGLGIYFLTIFPLYTYYFSKLIKS